MGTHTSYSPVVPSSGIDFQWDPSQICPDDISRFLTVTGNDDVIECWGEPFQEPKGRLMVNSSTPEIVDFCRELEQPMAPYLNRCSSEAPCRHEDAPYCLELANGTQVCIASQPWFATSEKHVWWVTERASRLSNGEIALASVLPVVAVLVAAIGLRRWQQIRRHRRNLASAGAGAYKA
ncbi:hypothetical protein DIURU_000073 [Diutina rugosa]|uniref:Uncharacterized protein n=1 Tax=Diutina rugosa TaxID=5481 RepID=A0A642V004_DIURU|nr:uncharacterized protein DIURU_000073 [Diutina rugosa]KAA8908760.1 hypothetical protein DIURU_000073 [Diutina rugosa]